jgi:ethanolamine ammonia-lyase small subunit
MTEPESQPSVRHVPDTDPAMTPAADADMQSILAAIRSRTPARLMLARQGGSYTTRVQVGLRQDHAAAMDAVWHDVTPQTDWGAAFCTQWQILETTSAAATKEEYLRRPDLGRIFSAAAAADVAAGCPAGADLQIVVGDGLSASAAVRQVPVLLPLVVALAKAQGWSLGRPIFVRSCRVGILNAVGELLKPQVVVLLIGERPGLQTAESLSAYLAFRPTPGHTDAHRNVISNIHAAGTPPARAAERIVALAAEMMRHASSGPAVKEQLSPQHAGLPQRSRLDTRPSSGRLR